MNLKETQRLEQHPEYKLLNILEQMLESAYVTIGENINLEHTFEYTLEGTYRWRFRDQRNIDHEIRLTYNPGIVNAELAVKFYWIKDNKPSYDKPPYTDERVFNTYLKILIDEILPQMSILLKEFNIDKITLNPTDYSRYRLYRLALNQILDKNKYNLTGDEENKLLYIQLKNG